MVVVVVAEQYEMDFRQIAQRNPGHMNTTRADPPKRATARGVNRIGQEIALRCFEQESCVVDPGGANPIGGQRWAWWRASGYAFGPAGGAAGEFPAENFAQAGDAGEVGVTKHASVAMVGDRIACGVSHGAWKLRQVTFKGKGSVTDGKKVRLTACETGVLRALSDHGPCCKSRKTES